MISIDHVSKYCKDPIDLIENYEAAINSPETWDCHHRLETELNLSPKELQERGLYFNRPASELILISHGEHTRLHSTGMIRSEETRNKNSKSHIGINPHDSMTPEEIEQWRKNKSEAMKGEKNPMYGKSPSNETRNKQSESLLKFWANAPQDIIEKLRKNMSKTMTGREPFCKGRHRVYDADGSYHYE